MSAKKRLEKKTGKSQYSEQSLLTALERCAADIRHVDMMSWQVPVVGAAVLYAITFLVQQAEEQPYFALLGTGASTILLLALTWALRKNRFFQESRVETILLIEKECNVYHVPVTSTEILRLANKDKHELNYGKLLHGKSGKCLELKAYQLIYYAMIFFIFCCFFAYVLSARYAVDAFRAIIEK